MGETFLTQAVVYLGAAIVIVPLVKKFNLSAVLGYLLAGVIIGPFVLGLVGSNQAEQEQVLHFAEFGVVMMLFIIGLELHPSLLWRLRGSIIGLGGLQVLLTGSAIAFITWFLGMTVQVSIAIGMVLALSSTAIVLQSLNEKGMMSTPVGKSIFSVLLFQDIAVIPMLAVLHLLVAPGAAAPDTQHSLSLIEHYPMWIQVIAVMGSVGLIVLLGRFGFNQLFHLVARTHIREIFTALALFIVVAIALLMQLVGLSPALGAFVAGVVLAESEYRHQLELDIEPFKGLLLGLFFMTVGAGIDFLLLSEAFTKILVLVAGLIVVKLIVLWIIAKIFKMNIGKRMVFTFSLAQAGEFAFVLFGMAFTLGVLDAELTKLLVLVVALSMMLTPILLIFLDKVIMPRLLTLSTPEPDNIEDDNNPVIIVGYGRFGQIIGRLLKANGFESTVLDFNSDHVDTIRRFGRKVYYGDATRIDLLKSAGAAKAKILVIAIADVEKSLTLIKEVRKVFPQLRIFVRAIGRQHAYELMDADVVFERETFLSALSLGEKVLTDLGYHPYRAKRASQIFKAHDNRILEELVNIYKENHLEYFESSKENEEIIAAILKADITGSEQNDQAWSTLAEEDINELVTEDKK